MLQGLGLHLAAVAVKYGGWWEGSRGSIRTLCGAYRVLAGSDASVALAASMHAGVLAQWRDPAPPATGRDEWEARKGGVFASVIDGAWWGTVTFEPGSGGDIANTEAVVARRDGSRRTVTGG